MIINHNLSAMSAHRYFKLTSHSIHNNIRKLSSGLRITRAGDDASGLAVSEKMRAQIRGLNQASRNAQDGISLIQTAEGWLSETTDILQRMRELAVQSANGIYTTEDRLQIQTEIQQLVDEVDRIASQAEFNTMKLLKGGFDRSGADAAKGAGGDAAAAKNSAMPPIILPTQGAPDAHELVRKDGDSPGGLYIHVGANTDQREKIYLANASASSLGLSKGPATGENTRVLSVSYTSQDGANRAIQIIDSALYVVGKQRADLGGFQNRLEHTIRGVDIAAENLQSAESQIRDLDMAKEMVDFVKNQILSQTNASMLAQANMRPQVVLRILG
ncbi:MAG TPA: flagellin [Spirochaetes bacterium]|nr:flagellin [Spirochaetota bacterium]